MLADDHVVFQDQVQVLLLHLGRHAVSASEVLSDERSLPVGERRLRLFSLHFVDRGHLVDVLGVELLNLAVGDVLEPADELISLELDCRRGTVVDHHDRLSNLIGLHQERASGQVGIFGVPHLPQSHLLGPREAPRCGFHLHSHGCNGEWRNLGSLNDFASSLVPLVRIPPPEFSPGGQEGQLVIGDEVHAQDQS